MQVHLSKWGNSLGLRIPKDVARQFHLAEGMQVDLRAEGERIVISVERPCYRLEQLVAGITPENMREAFYWGPDIGREVIEE